MCVCAVEIYLCLCLVKDGNTKRRERNMLEIESKTSGRKCDRQGVMQN